MPAEDPSPSPSPPLFVLVTAAGSSSRFGGEKKEFRSLGERTVLESALSCFIDMPNLAGLCVTAPPGMIREAREGLSKKTTASLGSRLIFAEGGATRRDSVRLGLTALLHACSQSPKSPQDDSVVLVHDGARPWASAALAERVYLATASHGAAIPIVPLTDTPKALNAEGWIVGHPARSGLGSAQTPQGFRLRRLLEAHAQAERENFDCTDDAELWARYVGPVRYVEGERDNKKITFREDLPSKDPGEAAVASSPGNMAADGLRDRSKEAFPALRVGEGWDLHRLVSGRRLMIGGIELQADFGEDAHSDGDVLLHAVIDAFLGASGLGDIGAHFPPSEERWKGADSRDLLASVLRLVQEAGWRPLNLDCTVILERPRLAPYKAAIREELAGLTGLDLSAVSVKAKTSESVNAVGEGRAIEARAVVLLQKRA